MHTIGQLEHTIIIINYIIKVFVLTLCQLKCKLIIRLAKEL